MVRVVGVEPTLLAERDFESRASTNFTTPAAWTVLLAATAPDINPTCAEASPPRSIPRRLTAPPPESPGQRSVLHGSPDRGPHRVPAIAQRDSAREPPRRSRARSSR